MFGAFRRVRVHVARCADVSRFSSLVFVLGMAANVSSSYRAKRSWLLGDLSQ